MKAEIFYNTHSGQIIILPNTGIGVLYEKYSVNAIGKTFLSQKINDEMGWRKETTVEV